MSVHGTGISPLAQVAEGNPVVGEQLGADCRVPSPMGFLPPVDIFIHSLSVVNFG